MAARMTPGGDEQKILKTYGKLLTDKMRAEDGEHSIKESER